MVNNSSSSIQSIGRPTGGLLSSTPHFCLVPEALYRKEEQDLWLNFLQEHIPHDQNILSDPIAEAGCVCLHQAENDTPTEHCIARLIRIAAAATEANKLFCYRNDERLCVTLFLHGKLQLANVFDAPADTDALYYLLDIYQQYNLNPQTTPAHIACNESGFYEFLTPYIKTQPLSL